MTTPVSSDFEVIPESSAEHPRERERWGGVGGGARETWMQEGWRICVDVAVGEVGPGSRSKSYQDWEPG